MKILRWAVAFALSTASAEAQDPLKVAPHAYRLQMENEWVRVVSVRYGPKERVAAHDHTALAAAFVYLNDSGPVVFNHLDKDYGAIPRAATKAGSFRIYFGVQEVHEVVNLTDVPSEFLRVEFKTQPKGDRTLKGRFFREPYPPGENFQKMHFENEQIRITRLICAPAKHLGIAAAPAEPALLVALAEGVLMATRDQGTKERVKLPIGQAEWLAVGQQRQFENTGTTPVEFLRFDFKTPPMSPEELVKRSSKPDHAVK